jgi:hypothetical protein
VGSKTASVHHPFGDAFVIEMEQLLPEVEIFQGGGTAGADPQGVLII